MQIPIKRISNHVQKKKSKVARKIDFNQDAQKMFDDDDDDDDEDDEDENGEEGDDDENEELMDTETEEDRNFINDSENLGEVEETDTEFVNSDEEEGYEEEIDDEEENDSNFDENDDQYKEFKRLKNIEKESIQLRKQLAQQKHLLLKAVNKEEVNQSPKLQDQDVSSSSKVVNEGGKNKDVCGNNGVKKNIGKNDVELTKATKEEMEKISMTEELMKQVAPYESTECEVPETTKYLSTNMLAHWGVHEIGKAKNKRSTTGLKLMRVQRRKEGYTTIWETVLFPKEVKNIGIFAFKNNIISVNEARNKKV